ncbi:hypothetical protein AB6A40_006108 [Gnathostoma spinigerum]|uniref:Uncharacterized protein n=1 Tax=Gnathostoma spinigerum TaxID=75299 RepID=A0ABD6EQ22_9BILA
MNRETLKGDSHETSFCQQNARFNSKNDVIAEEQSSSANALGGSDQPTVRVQPTSMKSPDREGFEAKTETMGDDKDVGSCSCCKQCIRECGMCCVGIMNNC